MAKKPSQKRVRGGAKTVLRLPDLDPAKSAVLNSLSSTDAQRGYRHATEEFIEWYCSDRGSLSARASCSGIVSPWRVGIWRPEPSISDSAQSAVSPMRRPIAGC